MSKHDRFSLPLATWFGCGRAPVAPGTFGSLGAIPLHLLLSLGGPGTYIAGVVTVSLLGIYAGTEAARELGEKDPQEVVIDEVAGTLIALGLGGGKSVLAQGLAVGLFRLLDITKPGLIDRAQHLKPVGLGIMADDLLAGVSAGLIARWLRRRAA